MTDKDQGPQLPPPLSHLEFHVLLILARGQLYGYAIKQQVEEQSQGGLSPEIGSLYRSLARLMERGWVEESRKPPMEEGPHRGKPRRYFKITSEGLAAARAEMQRMKAVFEAAEDAFPGLAT
ncbi:MAG: PadR family transcriptional regulator [Longimicrobiales bacterium]